MRHNVITNLFDRLTHLIALINQFKNKKLAMSTGKNKQRVICDTNVWYHIARGRFSPPDDIILIPTSLSLFELISSETIANDPVLLQKVVRAIHTYGKQIISVNPYDFVIMNLSASYKGSDKLTNNMLSEFSKVLNTDMKSDFKVDSTLKSTISEQCSIYRAPTADFAKKCNQELPILREKIKATTGIKEHLKADTRELIKAMTNAFFKHYIKEQKISFDTSKIDGSTIELFLLVSDRYFKHLETTDGMKVDMNDAVDWLNMLYVRPGDKYLTFEKSWKRYIYENEASKLYLYEPPVGTYI